MRQQCGSCRRWDNPRYYGFGTSYILYCPILGGAYRLAESRACPHYAAISEKAHPAPAAPVKPA